MVCEIAGAHRRSFQMRCSCGGLVKVTLSNLKSEQVKSCGCLRKETARDLGKKPKLLIGSHKAISLRSSQTKASRASVLYSNCSMTVQAAAALSGVSRTTLLYRINKGLTESTGLFEPVKAAPKGVDKPLAILKKGKSRFGLTEPTGFFKPAKPPLRSSQSYWPFL